MKTTKMILALALVLAACGNTDETSSADATTSTTAPTPIVVSTEDGLTVGSDENGLIASLTWLAGDHPSLGSDLPADVPRVSVLDGSTADELLIGYLGGGCPSEVTVNVVGDAENVSIEVEIGAYIAPEGLDCIDLLTMHGFQIGLTEWISLDNLVVAAG